MSGKSKRARKSSSTRGGSKRGHNNNKKSNNKVHFWTKLLQAIDDVSVSKTTSTSTSTSTASNTANAATTSLQLQLTDKHPLFHVLVETASSTETPPSKKDAPSTIDTATFHSLLPSYYFLLATSALQLLLPLQNEEDAYAAVALCARLTPFLHRRWPTATSRVLVGRSLIVLTAACTQALNVFLLQQQQNTSTTAATRDQRSTAILTAVLALDATTHPSSGSSSSSASSHAIDWSTGTQASWLAYVRRQQQQQADDDASSNNNNTVIPIAAVDWSVYEACVDALLEASPDEVTAAFGALPKIPRMDVRLALKRWTAVLLTWYGGQKLLLEAAGALLTDTANTNTTKLQWDGVQRVFTLVGEEAAHHHTKRKSAAAASAAVKAVAVAVPSHVTRLTLVGRLLHIVADVDSGAGCRPPAADGWETHMQQVLGATTHPAERSNIRHVSLMVLHHLLAAHADALAGRWVEWSTAPQDCRVRKLPDEYTLVAATTTALSLYEHSVSYYPYVLHAIRCLVACNGGAAQQQQQQALGALAVAWIWQGPRTDGTLVRHATDLLLSFLVEGHSAVSDKQNNNLSHLELHKPLTLPKPSRKRKASSSSSSSKTTEALWAGWIPDPGPTFGCDEKLALLLRGSPDLARVLVDTLEACYDTRQHTSDTTVASVAEGKRKSASSTATMTTTNEKSNKRQRNNTTKASRVSTTVVTAQQKQEDAPYGPLVEHRRSLACRILRALTKWMRNPAIVHHKGLSPLQKTLRERIQLDQIFRIVDLGTVLHKVLQAESSNNSTSSVLESVTGLDKNIWELQRDLQTALFGGPIAREDDTEMGRGEVLRVILERMASQSTRHSKDGWPISTTAAQQGLVSCGLTINKELPTPEVDTMMVHGFIKEVTWLLDKAQNIASALNTLDANETLLSLHDARFFCHSFMRLPAGPQDKAMISLLNPMHKLITKTRADTLDRFFSQAGVSAFFARLLTVCSNVVATTPFAREARRILHLRSKRVRRSSTAKGWDEDRHFQSIFNPRVPTIPCFDTLQKRLVSKTIVTKFHEVLDGCLDMGFKTAASDGCHLLFSTWNALGASPAWREVSPSINMNLKDSFQGQLSALLQEIRNDVCLVALKAKRQEGLISCNSLVESVCYRKLSRESSTTAAHDLPLLVQKCIKIIEQLVAQFVPDDEEMTQEIPVPVFSILQMCAHAISFGIANMTVPNEHAIPQMQREFRDSPRKRAYSSDSEGAHSEECSMSPNDTLLQVLDRLAEVSGAMGGVPCHPDWLDRNCILRPSLSHDDVLNTVKNAQAALTSLLLLSHQQFSKSRERAFGSLEPEASADQQKLALLLCSLHEYDTPMSSCCGDPYDAESDRDFGTDIATICGLKTESVQEFLVERYEPCSKVEQTWSGPSGQRVVGRFDSILKGENRREIAPPELRAAGEWESLLTTSLVAATDFETYPEHVCSAAQRDLLSQTERWDSVREACWEGLIPVSALARFCYSNGGREAHPLRSLDVPTEDLEELIPDYFDDDKNDVDKTDVPGCVRTLATIARLQVCGNYNAIAMHLMMEPRTFELLHGTEACSLSLQAIMLITPYMDGSKKIVEATKALLSRTLSIIEIHGAEAGRSLDMEPFDKPFKLLAACGVEILQVVPLCDENITPVEAFRKIGHELNIHSDGPEESRIPLRTKYVESLFKLCCHERLGLDTGADPCHFLTKLTSALGLLAMELRDDSTAIKSMDLLGPAVDILKQLPDDKLGGLVQRKFCAVSAKSGDLSARGYLCKLFAILVASGSMNSSQATSQVIYSTLAKSFAKWRTYEPLHRRCLLSLTVLYATHSNNVLSFGSTLLDDLQTATACPGDIAVYENMKDFINFLCLVRDHSAKQAITAPPQKRKHHPKLPPKCTYSGEELFLDQHWYNCLTCGLVDDKGCCSLCAVRCHAGHAVEYSRYSPFFCDCGSQADNKDDTEEVGESKKCECLADCARDAFFSEISERAHFQEESGLGIQSGHLLLSESAEIVAKCMRIDPKKLVSTFADKDRSSLWIRSLVDCTSKWLEKWMPFSTQNTSNVVAEMLQARQELLSRIGGKSQLDTTSSLSYRTMGSSESGTIVTKLENSGDDDCVKRSLLASRGTFKSVADADLRGRVVVAEKGALTFFASFSLVGNNDWFSLFTRKDMSLLSTVPVGMNAVGVKFCPFSCSPHESTILVWNEESAEVVIMREGCSVKDRVLTLGVKVINSDGGGEDGVINCEWLNHCLVLVGCCRSLQVFCIDGSESLCESSLTLPHRIRNFAAISSGADAKVGSWRLFLVSTEGRLRSCEINSQDDDTFSVGGWEQHDDLLRELCGFPEEKAELECTTLAYLAQSRLLICDIGTHGSIALCLDSAGKTAGGFELAKNKLPSQVSTKGPIVGPFRHWRELGIVHLKSQTYFSVCCTGSHDVTKKTAVLVFFFNGSGTLVQLVSILPKIEGIAAVSMPMQNASAMFTEHNVIFLICGNGAMEIFRQTCGTRTLPLVLAAEDDDNRLSFNPDFEVLAFEELKNITHSPQLAMSSDAIESLTLKQNLLPDNELYATSPKSDGFVMTVSLRSGPAQGNVMLEPQEHETENELVISAIRVLFGATSTCRIPRSFKVMGRSIDVPSGSRGWYSVILDRQELAFSMRFGFVIVEFKESHDSTRGPYIDAVEVYAKHRDTMEQWLPFFTTPVTPRTEATSMNDDDDPDQLGFVLALDALAKFKTVCGAAKSTKAEKLLLKQVIQETAYTKCAKSRKMVNQLLDGFEFDDAARSLFSDKSVLAACSNFLKRCDILFSEVKGTDREASATFSVIPTLRSCLRKASNIARARPFNYLQVAEEASGSSGSIASDANSIVLANILAGFAIPALIEDLVGLMLLEIAVTNGSPRGRFGNLDGLRQLLLCQHRVVVEFVCKAISQFCRLQNIFEAQPMALGYVCDYCLCVIDEERFSSGEGNFDLCPECYNHGRAFCDSSVEDSSEFVVIKGKPVGEAPKLTCGELMKMVSTKNDSTTEQRTNQLSSQSSRMVFNAFMDGLCHGLTPMLIDKMRTMQSIPSSLILVCVDLFQHSVQTNRSNGDAKKILRALSSCLSTRIEESLAWNVGLREDFVLILEGIAALVYPSRTQRQMICGLREDVICTENEDHGVCCLHGTPATVNYVKTGLDADRQFYACANQAPCRFFRWKDTADPLEASAGVQLRSSADIGSLVWESLSKPGAFVESSIADRLCELVRKLLDNISLDGTEDTERKKVRLSESSLRTVLSGALCSVSRLECEMAFNGIASGLHKGNEEHIITNNGKLGKHVVDCAFQLVTLVGSADLQQFCKWLPVLSELVTSKVFQTPLLKRTQHLSRQVLVQFCGIEGSQETIDYFCRSGHIGELSLVAQELLDYCRVVNEKANRSRENWDGEPVLFSQLTMTNMMGVHLLVNEHASPMSTCARVNTIFSEMTALINKHHNTDSWRRFCGMHSIAHVGSGVGMDVAPLKQLFAIACASSPTNQTWALRMINASLKANPDPIAGKHHEEVLKFLYPDGSTPENVLGLSVNDGVLFAVRFVLWGHSTEARGLGTNILTKLFAKTKKSALEKLVKSLVEGPLKHVGSVGKRSTDFFNLLKSLIDLGGQDVVPVALIARSLQICITEQFLAIRHDRQNGEYMLLETKSASSIQKKRYEFSRCASCRIHTSKYKPKGDKTFPRSGRGDARKAGGSSLLESSPTSEKIRSPPEQVTPQARGKFGLSKENSCSSEFAAYFSLRYRIALYAVHVEIENARRYVKTINVYFTSRPVQEASTLKSPEHAVKWQLCGTFDLSRGCTRASIVLDQPVVAANIKIEYSDFHDRPGVSKSNDGKTIACPRCSGDVNVAHGVCTSCGEAAFQCRKCRHINYDRLDAFLCVECGYSASASFQFEVTAGMATNAVAITNDEELARSQSMLKVASRCYSDYKCAIKQKLTLVSKTKKSSRSVPHDGGTGPSTTASIIKSAFQGDEATSYHNGEKADFTKLSLNQIGKAGSVLKLVARPERLGDESSPMLGVQQRRSRSASRRPEGILIRGLGADGEEESASELLSSLLESGGLSRYASGLDTGDPLSRLLASVHSRQAGRSASDDQPQEHPEEGEERNKSNKKKDKSSNGNSSKEALEICDRLYTLMMEAEREVFELERRIAAWETLVQGQLGAISFPNEFLPSHCSQCSLTVALQLLLLWLKIFQLDPNAVDISDNFVSMLLRDEPGHHLKETRRLVVKEIALKSNQGQKVVLEALRNRLLLLQDMTSAEILRKILEEVDSSAQHANPFVELAKEVLTKGVDGHSYRFA